MDLQVLERSLVLTPVVTGKEPFILTYTIPLNMDASADGYLPNDENAQRRTLVLQDNDRSPGGYYFIRQTNGTYLIKWNTTFASYGLHTLRVCLRFGGLDRNRTKVFGPTRTENVTNIVQWEYDATGFGSRTWFHGFLHMRSADYKIAICDTNKNLIKTISGHTEKGVIDEIWDLTTAKGKRRSKRNDEVFEAQVYITPTITDTNGLIRSNAPTVRVLYP
jgi:hypothetical protein